MLNSDFYEFNNWFQALILFLYHSELFGSSITSLVCLTKRSMRPSVSKCPQASPPHGSAWVDFQWAVQPDQCIYVTQESHLWQCPLKKNTDPCVKIYEWTKNAHHSTSHNSKWTLCRLLKWCFWRTLKDSGNILRGKCRLQIACILWLQLISNKL